MQRIQKKERGDRGMAFLLQFENVAWYEDGKVRILDRRIYPIRTEYVVCETHGQVAQAIADMVTQSGGPYLAAAMGMVLAAYEAKDQRGDDLLAYLTKAAYTLSHARPTTTAKMEKVTDRAIAVARNALAAGCSGQDLVDAMFENAFRQANESYLNYRSMAAYLADLTPKKATVMTQCFAETILGAYFNECLARDYELKIICPETRPYYQGARLTASVAKDMGLDVTVITDNMPGYVLQKKQVDLFTSAADVITMDGYVVNKIGTFQIALAANYWGIPYFVTGVPNQGHPRIDTVPIEERDPALATESMGQRLTMEGVSGYYPAFDITPPKLISGVVTDKGVFAPLNLPAYWNAQRDSKVIMI